MSSRPDTMIIGIGNEYRGDDAVGLYIARKISEDTPSNCVIKEAPGEGIHLINTWEGFDRVIIIDAVRSGSIPGTVHRVDATNQKLPDDWVHHSAHTVSLPEAIRLARALKVLPVDMTIYGIEGICFDPGAKLSDEVRDAANRLIPELIEQVQRDR